MSLAPGTLSLAHPIHTLPGPTRRSDSIACRFRVCPALCREARLVFDRLCTEVRVAARGRRFHTSNETSIKVFKSKTLCVFSGIEVN